MLEDALAVLLITKKTITARAYNSDFSLFRCAWTDFMSPRPASLISFFVSSRFFWPSSYWLCKLFKRASRSSSAFFISASFSSIAVFKSAMGMLMKPSIFFLFSASQRSKLAGPQRGPKLSLANFCKALKSRPP